MQKFGKSQPAPRREDVRLLTGEGRFVDDTVQDGALRAFFLRAPVAHAEITQLYPGEARNLPGVALVLTAEELQEAGVTETLQGALVTGRDSTQMSDPKRPLLATNRVRYVGEPIAMIIAQTLTQARDAAELIELDFADLAVKTDRAPGGPTVHEGNPDNVAFDWAQGDEAQTEAAIAAAAHVVQMRVEDHRVIVNSIEPRGTTAWMAEGRLNIVNNGQGVWETKRGLAKLLSMEPDAIRVITDDVGGGFGMKSPLYAETVLVAQAARMLEKPVHWMGERGESMLSDHAGRDLHSDATLAFDADFRIVAYKVENTVNMGAYNNNYGQFMQSELFARVLTGPYDIQTTWHSCIGVFSNTTPTDAYRGAGRPEAIYVLERMMDLAARELGVDPLELRRRNFIRVFPYRSATGELYDVGDFPRLLDHCAARAELSGFAVRRSQSAAAGKLRGIGICYYIESILGSPKENCRVDFAKDGVQIYVGTQSNGQGHETVYAKFLSDQTGIPFDEISVVQGDSDLIAQGGGTGGSRSVTTQNNATLATVGKIVDIFSAFLAEFTGVDVEKVSFDHERFRVSDSNLTLSMLEVAEMMRAASGEEVLSIEETAKLPGRSYPNGAHIAEVEVDPATGQTSLVSYTVVDDFGNLINPMLAEGQVHGGVAQGVGQALCERAVFDGEGQLLSGSFMDYAMPRADDLPMIGFTSDPVPSTANAMGMKGCGEAGTVGAMAALANAVQDALWNHGVRKADMPFTPARVWHMLRAG